MVAQIAEKHSLTYTMLAVIDRRGRCLWMSPDPTNKIGLLPAAVLDDIGEPYRDHVKGALAECLLEQKTVAYITDGSAPPPWEGDRPRLLFRVTLFPMDVGEGAILAYCTMLPSCFEDLTVADMNVLCLLASGKTLNEAAERVNRTTSAMDAKVRRLKDLFGVDTIGGLVAVAIRRGVI